MLIGGMEILGILDFADPETGYRRPPAQKWR
jgi:hypothetical protein